MIESEMERRFTQGMAAAFFDLSGRAFKMKESRGDFVSVDNEQIIPKRGVDGDEPRENDMRKRKYSLYDIRRIAHALRANGKLSDRQLRLVIMRLDAFSEPLLKRNRKRLYKEYGARYERKEHRIRRINQDRKELPSGEGS